MKKDKREKCKHGVYKNTMYSCASCLGLDGHKKGYQRKKKGYKMKVLIEIEVPIAKRYCLVDDDGKEEGFNFSEFISKKLTNNWFGCGSFSCKIKKIIKDK